MHKKDHRGTPGGSGHGMSGSIGPGAGKRLKRKVAQSKGGNKTGGIGSHQVKVAHNRHKMNNQKVISSMRKS